MPPVNKLIDAILDYDWDTATFIIQSQPNLAKKKFASPSFLGQSRATEVLPIHQAVAMDNVPLPFIQLLISSYPNSIQQQEVALQRLPIHIALRKNSQHDDLIQYLLKECPSSVSVPDAMGRLPIHYACSNHASLRTLRELITINPDSIYAMDKSGWSPLHVASSIHTSIEVIQFLLHAGPSVIVAKTNKGSNPVNCAENSDALNKEELLKVLREARSVFVKTDPMYKVLKEAKRKENVEKARKGTPQKMYTEKVWGVRKQLNDDDVVEVV